MYHYLSSFLVADQEQQYRFAQQQQQQQQQSQFSDPAIMFGVPLAGPHEAFGRSPQAFGPPPGLTYPPDLQNSVVNDGEYFFALP
jgi:hypothetical protein